VWVWGAKNATLHLWLWVCLVFWFGLCFFCVLCVGRWVGSHSHVRLYVGECGCGVGVCWVCLVVDHRIVRF